MSNSVFVAVCVFPNSAKGYMFKCADPNLVVGDTVVVDTSNNGLQLARVETIVPLDSHKNITKWVVQRVDNTAHKIEQLTAEVNEYTARLRTEASALSEEQLWIALADRYTVFRELLRKRSKVKIELSRLTHRPNH